MTLKGDFKSLLSSLLQRQRPVDTDFAFKKSKKPDPLKTSISQYLQYAYSVGPESCEMEVFNGPI
jgi:hypothetical protein